MPLPHKYVNGHIDTERPLFIIHLNYHKLSAHLPLNRYPQAKPSFHVFMCTKMKSTHK